MSELVPLFQTALVWMVILVIVLVFYIPIKGIISAIQGRIKEGSGLDLSPSGLILREQLKGIQKTAQLANKESLYIMGLLYRFQKKWESSKEAFENVIGLDPNYTPAYVGLAETLRDESKTVSVQEKKIVLERALHFCNKAVIIEKYPPAFLCRATIYHALENRLSAEVVEDLKEAVRLKKEMKKFIFEEEEFRVYKNDERFKQVIT